MGTQEVRFVREIEHNIKTYTSHNKKKIYFENPTNVTDDLLICALLDHRGGNDGSKEDIYFKSEVAVKDKDYGWVMWNGLTTKKGQSPSLYMEYRLLLLKKKTNGNEWEIDKGYGWSSPQSSDSSDYVYDQLSVVPPAGDWRTTNAKKGGYSQRRVWSAVAKVGTPVKPKPNSTEDDEVDGDDVVSSLKIYMKSTDPNGGRKGEFFGNGPN